MLLNALHIGLVYMQMHAKTVMYNNRIMFNLKIALFACSNGEFDKGVDFFLAEATASALIVNPPNCIDGSVFKIQVVITSCYE